MDLETQRKKVGPLNERLRSELGTVGEKPRFQWVLSADLFVMLTDPNYVTDSGILVMAPRNRKRKRYPQFEDDQWCLCRYDEEEGVYGVVSDLGGPCVLSQGVCPDARWTQVAIDAIRNHRSQDHRDGEVQFAEAFDAKQKKQEEELAYALRNSVTLGGLPGEKTNVSFGGIGVSPTLRN